MPEINQSLQGKDLQFLQRIASIWGIELTAHDLRSTIQLLSSQMNHKDQFLEIVDCLTDESKQALQEIHTSDGKIPWSIFTRKYGEIRVMGAARRERERPDLNPINATEVLWYSGMLGKAFFNLHKEPLEYAYIPDEFQQFLTRDEQTAETTQIPGRPATTQEKQFSIPVTDQILDHMTTLLAAIRTGQSLQQIPWLNQEIPIPFLHSLANVAQFVDADDKIQPAQVRKFMESARAEALLMLVNAWKNMDFNDLLLLPGFIFEGQWKNDPVETRNFILEVLQQIPVQTWWSISAFVAHIRNINPDFQRPAGDYDFWYIRRQNSEEYLRGIRYWDEIDGTLIRTILGRHMHWLGLIDLAAPDPDANPGAFRASAWANHLLTNTPPKDLPSETDTIKVLSDGVIQVPRQTSRAIRYQIARFCHLDKEEKQYYRYLIQPDSLSAALKAGLKIEQFISLLNKTGRKPIPPNIFTLLENWKTAGVQAVFAPVMMLTVQNEKILDSLFNSRAKKYLGERLNTCTVLINEKQIKLVMSILAELGYLSEVQSVNLVKIRKG